LHACSFSIFHTKITDWKIIPALVKAQLTRERSSLENQWDFKASVPQADPLMRTAQVGGLQWNCARDPLFVHDYKQYFCNYLLQARLELGAGQTCTCRVRAQARGRT